MDGLEPPWTGLAELAPRIDLWPVLRAFGATRRAEEADVPAWCAAGLPLKDAIAVGRSVTWRGEGLHSGAPGWPRQLDDVPYGPVALLVEGNTELLGRPGVGVVGARACTAYGRDWARRIGAAVVAAGGVVVSGLAAGIDAEAHASAGGATIAVLGQGLRAPMPAWQMRLREALLDRGGLVVSEFRPDAGAQPWTFPVRNRIIAALSVAVVVVEAGARSGARNTASHALRCGREILAVPGPLGATASVGCLDLLEQGATMVRSPATVLEAARLDGATAAPRGPGDRIRAALLGGGTPEEIAVRTGLDRPAVMEALGFLELTGQVKRLPGRRYIPA